MHARGLRPRRARSMLAISHSSVLPSARWNSVGALISDPFHGSITLPACSPVNASRAALRLPAHDSGPGWLATPYLYDSCIRDFTPVYPGALQPGSKTADEIVCAIKDDLARPTVSAASAKLQSVLSPPA